MSKTIADAIIVIGESNLRLRIYSPVPSVSADGREVWECEFVVDADAGRYCQKAYGLDSFQVLVGAIFMATGYIKAKWPQACHLEMTLPTIMLGEQK